MSTYKEMYLTLIRAQRDAILILQEAHQKTEDLLLSAEVPDHLRVVHLEAPPDGEPPDLQCLNLSPRLYNGLKYQFGGRNHVPTIEDVLSMESYEQLRKIRNLGKKTCVELILKMQAAGFTDWAERMRKSEKRDIGLEPTTPRVHK